MPLVLTLTRASQFGGAVGFATGPWRESRWPNPWAYAGKSGSPRGAIVHLSRRRGALYLSNVFACETGSLAGTPHYLSVMICRVASQSESVSIGRNRHRPVEQAEKRASHFFFPVERKG